MEFSRMMLNLVRKVFTTGPRVLSVVSLLSVNVLGINLAQAVTSEESVPKFSIEPLANNVYLHQSFQQTESFGLVGANGLVVINEGKAFIVDTPWSESDTAVLVDWIKEQGYQLVGSVSTHSHEDRTAGIGWLNAHSIPTFASELTNQILKESEKPLASHPFALPQASLFDGQLEAFYPGGGHALDNLVVWLPKSNILFGGCLVRSLDSTSLGYTGEAVLEQWPTSAMKVLAKFPDVELVVPGHGEPGDKQLLIHTKALAESGAKQASAK
ncbi:Beta-lactamase [Shewanella denitrificans OS217]|uniref:beta-lactamase n=1 Tax=Shewanella denitrificans (strain OS217 / ATCC BAA-1090 / DSM 15013) TaxID=318161 RepID=Q12R15_SHEDO|nr:subclass B1 metallo-beta-lactamase SHD-1 [Shewanella denitrificans]ABE54111.1 Beta-lactamase [Shewanella denitrificans OS217]